jgi:hypothetical protein
MSIERNERIKFHEQGTLDAVTRWISSHHDGIAEWFKNVRRQYQVDRANVADQDRVAVLLLRDAKESRPARIGVLDVGGATLEDVTAWDTWQDPDASKRGSTLPEEQTQGNGGKAYMYRLFSGQARILGVRDRRRNCRGFEGEIGSVDRGNPGWIPTTAGGREVEISSLEGELREALQPYGVTADDLPPRVRTAITSRKAFTLVEGNEPVGVYKGRIDCDDLLGRVVRHDQATLCLEQVDFFAIHNGRIVGDGKKLVLPAITPYPQLDSPFVYEIPDQLALNDGQMVSTTDNGTRERGRLTLHTSAENMPAAWRNLKPRWQIIYRTRHQMIGAKPVSDVAGTTPSAQYVYGTVELAALEPAYVEHGRRRPKDGPLLEALDRFVAEKIKGVAQQINSKRRQELDAKALDEVHDENKKLDEFKNQYLPSYDDATNGGGGRGGSRGGGGRGGGGGGSTQWGTEPDVLEYTVPENGIDIGNGVGISLRTLLNERVRDATGRPVRAGVEWMTTNTHVAAIKDSVLEGSEKGICEIWGHVKGTKIESARIPVRVWNVDHVLLTPRNLDLPIGTRQQIIAETTDDDGKRSTEVLLDWRHDADDPMLVRISHEGQVMGNRLGRTAITAGAGKVWARIPVEVKVIPNPQEQKRGSGFPRLLLTGRDEDPATGKIRESDPDQPALWQEPSDFVHNVWWLNIESPEAAFAFRQRRESPTLWRTYHASQVIEMVVRVWMSEDFTKKGESQVRDYWDGHLAALTRHRVRIVQEMWKRIEPYVSGADLDTGDPQ